MLTAKEARRQSKKNSTLSELDLAVKEIETGINDAVARGETETTISLYGSFEGYKSELHDIFTEAGYEIGFDMDYNSCSSRLVIGIRWA